MKKTLSLASVAMLSFGAIATLPESVSAREVDCVNYWVNPKNVTVECFEDDMSPMALPGGYYRSQSAGYVSQYTGSGSSNEIGRSDRSERIVRASREERLARRQATSQDSKIVMPDLVGSKIDVAEDYLLSLGINLGSEPVYSMNKTSGEITQQFPAPGTELNKGETVLLEYMGASVNPSEIGTSSL